MLVKHSTSWAVLAGFLAAGAGQCAVFYSPGPLPPPPPLFLGAGQAVDFDGDGFGEIEFESGLTICTMDFPTSFCSTPCYVRTASPNQLLAIDRYAAILSPGELIGDVPPPHAPWSGLGFEGYLTTRWWSLYGQEIHGQRVFWGWTGPLGVAGSGYVGARFHAADSVHYGWIRVSTESPALVVDWAYETRPDTPILAGAGIDVDHDGIWDWEDECPNTPAGEAVDLHGCSLNQLVPCEGPWRSHGEYVAAVARTATDFRRQGWISAAQARAIIRAASQSDCGKTSSRGNRSPK